MYMSNAKGSRWFYISIIDVFGTSTIKHSTWNCFMLLMYSKQQPNRLQFNAKVKKEAEYELDSSFMIDRTSNCNIYLVLSEHV